MASQPLNNASGALRYDHLVGSDTLVLKVGQGDRFGTPTVDSPIRVTVARRPTLVSGRIEPETTKTIFLCTARSGDTLSGLTAVEGTSDQRFYKHDPIASLITAGTIDEIRELAESGGNPNAVLTTETYSDPEWLVGLSPAKVTGLADTLAETEATVTAAAATAEAASAEATAAAAAVAGKADDAAVVKLTGDQAIAGAKTLTDPITLAVATGVTLAQKFDHQDGEMPYTHTYGPTRFVGSEDVVDHVFSHGWHAEDAAPDQPIYTENWESRFVNGAPPLGLLERHSNYQSIDRTVSYRPWVMYIDLNTSLQYLEYRVGVATWLGGPDGSIPLLNLDTGGGNGGRVRIENDGANSPLEVVGTAGNIDFQLNSGQNLRLATVQAADAVNTTRNGVGLTMNGAYWTGSASAGAAASIQTIVTGNNAFHSLWSVGASDFTWKNDGKLGLNVPLAKLTQNIVIRAGYVAAIDDFDNGPYRIVGLDGATGRIIADPDGRGFVFPNTVYFGAYGSGSGPRMRSGAGGVDNSIVINAGSAGSSSNIVYFNLDSQNARIDAYGQFNLYADGSAGKCLSVGTGSPTGILFAGNGVAHYGIRCTASTGLFELMAAGGNDPRTWTASTASLAVPGSVTAGSFSGVGSGLTSLNPANISAGTAGISITGNAATATTATTAGTISGSIAQSQVTNLTTDLAAKAPLASPTFTGTVTAPFFSGDGSGLTNLPGGGGGGGGSTLAFVATSSKTVSNTTTETSLFGTGVGSLTIPAGTLTPGKTYRIRLMGNTTAASGANQFRVTLGGVTLWATSSNTMTAASNQVTILEVMFTCRATGATNTVMTAALVTTLTSSSAQRYGGAGNEFVAANVNTAIDNDIDATVKFSVADPGNSITITNATVETFPVPS